MLSTPDNRGQIFQTAGCNLHLISVKILVSKIIVSPLLCLKPQPTRRQYCSSLKDKIYNASCERQFFIPQVAQNCPSLLEMQFCIASRGTHWLSVDNLVHNSMKFCALVAYVRFLAYFERILTHLRYISTTTYVQFTLYTVITEQKCI